MRNSPKPKLYKLLNTSIFGIFLLTGCDQFLTSPTTDNNYRNINVSTNAALVAMRDGDKPWNVRQSGNTGFSPSADSLLVTNDQLSYSILLVCPSNNRSAPHRVYYYLGVSTELGEINHLCRKSDADISRERVYGSVSGIDVNENQKARLALGNNRGEWVYEACAFEEIAGIYDILGYLATVQADGSVRPDRLIKQESVALGNLPPNQVDIDFSVNSRGSIKTSLIPTHAHATATVSGMPSNSNWVSEVNFRSERQSYLTLAKNSITPLSFFGFPLFTEGDSVPVKLQSDDEGHEFISRIYNEKSQAINIVSHFFKDPHDVQMQFATGSLSVDTVKPVEHEDGVSINLDWSTAIDSNYGEANLYHWVVAGDTAPAPICDSCGGVDSKLLEWHIIASPGWFKSQTNKLAISLPPIVDISDHWSRTWNFSVTTTLDWEAHAYFSDVDKSINPTNEDTGAEAMLKYLFNQEYINGLTFAELIARRS